jgi:hypothetical protein
MRANRAAAEKRKTWRAWGCGQESTGRRIESYPCSSKGREPGKGADYRIPRFAPKLKKKGPASPQSMGHPRVSRGSEKEGQCLGHPALTEQRRGKAENVACLGLRSRINRAIHRIPPLLKQGWGTCSTEKQQKTSRLSPGLSPGLSPVYRPPVYPPVYQAIGVTAYPSFPLADHRPVFACVIDEVNDWSTSWWVALSNRI